MKRILKNIEHKLASHDFAEASQIMCAALLGEDYSNALAVSGKVRHMFEASYAYLHTKDTIALHMVIHAGFNSPHPLVRRNVLKAISEATIKDAADIKHLHDMAQNLARSCPYKHVKKKMAEMKPQQPAPPSTRAVSGDKIATRRRLVQETAAIDALAAIDLAIVGEAAVHVTRRNYEQAGSLILDGLKKYAGTPVELDMAKKIPAYLEAAHHRRVYESTPVTENILEQALSSGQKDVRAIVFDTVETGKFQEVARNGLRATVFCHAMRSKKKESQRAVLPYLAILRDGGPAAYEACYAAAETYAHPDVMAQIKALDTAPISPPPRNIKDEKKRPVKPVADTPAPGN